MTEHGSGAERRAEELFERALELPAGEREAFVERELAGEPEALAEARALLRADRWMEEATPSGRTLRRRLEVALAGGAAPGKDDATVRRLEEIGARERPSERYEPEGEVGSGGMGTILAVHDRDLDRRLAMKIVRGVELQRGSSLQAPASQRLDRFFEEAQVTGQLDHPGVVPVHDVGLDADGRMYFTMKLVRGEDLARVFRKVARGEEGWSLPRALNALLKVCEAMAYAHDHGVIHRDLKPANVMVGRYGEVYVMDWGLARVEGRPDVADPTPAGDGDASLVHTLRSAGAGREGSAQLVTLDGTVVGTPAYMPPEQARGQRDEMSPRSDVYSVGAMLYHLLAGRAPYHGPDGAPSAFELLKAVIDGPPEPVERLAPRASAELVAICDKAMAREPARRYGDMGELADDLRAYLEDRVVRAHRVGALAELRKWVRRNRALALSTAAALLVIVVGLAVASYVLNRKAEDVLSLSALQELDELAERADALWPLSPALRPELEAWEAQARALIEGDAAAGRPGLADYEARLARMSAGGTAATREERWWAAQLGRLVAGLEELRDGERSLWRGVSPERSLGVGTRLELVRRLEEETLTSEDARRRWAELIEELADPGDPLYGGLDLEPVFGLLPLRRDPESGLWELALLTTGDAPEVDAGGRYVLTEDTGLVLVLIPPAPMGLFLMGAQKESSALPNYASLAYDWEGPPHEVELDAFLLSKYELTQAQWKRLTGAEPGSYGSRNPPPEGDAPVLLHPVETVSWETCMALLPRFGLTLPTEAQWEWAARGMTDTPWWTGESMLTLEGAANVNDRASLRGGAPWAGQATSAPFDDGYVVHAPVGRFRPNPFGLCDVHGNVWELCLDVFVQEYRADGWRAGDGLRLAPPDAPPTLRSVRGGGFQNPVDFARSAFRDNCELDSARDNIGLRPAMRLP